MISIVITSYSVERLSDIRDLLSSIKDQTMNDLEVVIITEGEELTHSLTPELNKTAMRGAVIKARNGTGLAMSRNLGLERATGDIVAFIDDDIILDKNWCHTVATAFASYSRAVCITGPAIPFWEAEPMDWLPLELDWLIGCTRWVRYNVPTEVTNAWGMNMCFRRKSLYECGGFSDGTGMQGGHTSGRMGEDVDISKRVMRNGGKILFVPGLKVYHKVRKKRLTTSFILERSIRVGYDRGLTIKTDQLIFGKATEPRLLALLLRSTFLIVLNNRLDRLSDKANSIWMSTIAIMGVGIGFIASKFAFDA